MKWILIIALLLLQTAAAEDSAFNCDAAKENRDEAKGRTDAAPNWVNYSAYIMATDTYNRCIDTILTGDIYRRLGDLESKQKAFQAQLNDIKK